MRRTASVMFAKNKQSPVRRHRSFRSGLCELVIRRDCNHKEHKKPFVLVVPFVDKKSCLTIPSRIARIDISSYLSAAMRTLAILMIFCTATLFAEDKVMEIKGPLTEDGLIDFFKAAEELIYPPEFATDDNGFRIFTRQFGVVGDATRYGQYYRLQTYEKLKLDPDTPPTLEYPKETFSIITEYYKAKGETYNWSRGGSAANPWTLEQLPMLADWVKEIDKPLDAIAEAIRKPVFLPPLGQPEEWLEPESPRNLISIPLPNHTQLCRDIARHFQARAMYRVGQGNIDGAIDDKLVVHRLGRQTSSGGFFVPYLVGITIEGMAGGMLIDANPERPFTKEQIQRLLAGLDALPPRASTSLAHEAERLSILSVVQDLAVAHKRGGRALHDMLGDVLGGPVLPIMLPASFDWNVVYRRVNEICDAMQEPPPKEKFHAFLEAADNLNRWEGIARTLLTRDGLEMCVADSGIALLIPVNQAVEEAVRRLECAENMQRLVWAIKLYQLDNDNKLPVGNWAEKIAPYLGENPERYFSCPSNPSPKGETTYALVQYGDAVPEHYETILLVELKVPVPLDKAVVTVDEVLEMLKKHLREPRLNPAPHPGGMNNVRRSGAVLFLNTSVSENELSRLLGRGRAGE